MKHLVTIFCTLALLGCAATPYQKYDGLLSRGGYEEEKIGENSYRLTFTGNGFTDPAQVNAMWLRRATELCHGSPKEINPTKEVKSTEMTTAVGGAFITSHPSKTVASGNVICR